jgi:hypothetical protein
LVTVNPAALDASDAVTRVQASTLVISFAEGDVAADGLPDEAEGELDDPHAATRRPANTSSAKAP